MGCTGLHRLALKLFVLIEAVLLKGSLWALLYSKLIDFKFTLESLVGLFYRTIQFPFDISIYKFSS